MYLDYFALLQSWLQHRYIQLINECAIFYSLFLQELSSHLLLEKFACAILLSATNFFVWTNNEMKVLKEFWTELSIYKFAKLVDPVTPHYWPIFTMPFTVSSHPSLVDCSQRMLYLSALVSHGTGAEESEFAMVCGNNVWNSSYI